jgi:hypothetical protein
MNKNRIEKKKLFYNKPALFGTSISQGFESSLAFL